MTMTKNTGAELIALERRRQIEQEGYSAEHDAVHGDSELAWAAYYYAMPCLVSRRCSCDEIWAVTLSMVFAQTEWDEQHAKRQGFSGDRVRDLVKAGALIAAEIDRLSAGPVEVSDDSE